MRRDQYGTVFLLAVVLMVSFWAMFAYEAATGLTFERREIGSIASPDRVTSTRRRAVLMTVFCAPVAIWCFLARRPEQ